MRYFGGQVTKADDIRTAYFSSNPRALKFLEGGFCDPFSGSGAVAKAFSEFTHVSASDYANFAYYFTSAALLPTSRELFIKIENLNRLVDEVSTKYLEHNFTQNYSTLVPYFTAENACRIMAYRDLTEEFLQKGELTQEEYQVVMGMMLSRVLYIANTRLLFDGPLKSSIATQTLMTIPIPTHTQAKSKWGVVINHCDYEESYLQQKGGVLYLNPPSLPKDYRHYYHLLDTIIEQKTGEIKDKAGRLDGFKDRVPVSEWNKPLTARSAFYKIMLQNQADYIVMAYNKSGVLSEEDITSGFLRNGSARTFRKLDLGNEWLFAIERN